MVLDFPDTLNTTQGRRAVIYLIRKKWTQECREWIEIFTFHRSVAPLFNLKTTLCCSVQTYVLLRLGQKSNFISINHTFLFPPVSNILVASWISDPVEFFLYHGENGFLSTFEKMINNSLKHISLYSFYRNFVCLLHLSAFGIAHFICTEERQNIISFWNSWAEIWDDVHTWSEPLRHIGYFLVWWIPQHLKSSH